LGFIKKHFSKKRALSRLEQQLDLFNHLPKETYQGHKLITSKKDNYMFLVNTAFLNVDKIKYGSIYIVTSEKTDISSNKLSYIINLNDADPHLLIVDIMHHSINEGIGSELLQYTAKIAQAEGIKFVKGWLSNRDLIDHRERLLHFYEKNGFSIGIGPIPDSNIEGLIVTKIL